MSRVFAGPWAGQVLADFGADVVKVEHPDGGDDVRRMGTPALDAQGRPTGDTSSFLAMNRGKRSIALDLASPGGQDTARRLAAHADVLIENFRTGGLARYGLDYPTLSALNPRLVYCSVTGFGQTGPYADLPGYDPVFQAMSGLLSVTGVPEGEPGAGPVLVGYSVADISAGFYAALGILAALRHRDQTSGRGQHLDLALLDAQIAAQSHMVMNHLVSGRTQRRAGLASQINAPWQAFDTADEPLVVAVGNDRQFGSLAAALDLPALARDPRFATAQSRIAHAAELLPPLAEAFLARGAAEWQRRLLAALVPAGPIHDFAAMIRDPQVRHRGMIGTLGAGTSRPVPHVANPLRFSDTPLRYERPPPALDEHRDEVLRDWAAAPGHDPAPGG